MDKGSLWNGSLTKSQYLYPSLYYDEPRYRYSYLYPKYHSLDNLLSYKYYEKPLRKAVAFTGDSDENLKSSAHSSSMSDLLAKLKDFVFEQEKQLTDDLLNKISRSRQLDSPLRSATSYNNLKDAVDSSVSSDLLLNPVNRRDNFYKRYNAYAKRILKPLPTSSIRRNPYKPFLSSYSQWYDSDYDYDSRWARWYNRYLNSSRHCRYLPDYDYYYIPKLYPISLPPDVKSIVKDKTKSTLSDDSKSYTPEIKSSYCKYDPFESDTYFRSRLPSWKQYYYTQKLKSKPSKESSLQYYDPHYDFFPDSASVDSTDELVGNNAPVEDELPSDTKQLIDDYRDAIYENIIKNLRSKQLGSNTFPRRKSARLRRSLSSTWSPERSNARKFLDEDKFHGAEYNYGSSLKGKYSPPSNVACEEPSGIYGAKKYEFPESYSGKNFGAVKSDNDDGQRSGNLAYGERYRDDKITYENPVAENVLSRTSQNDQSLPKQEEISSSKMSTRVISPAKSNEAMNKNTVTFASSVPQYYNNNGRSIDRRDSVIIAQNHVQRKPSIDQQPSSDVYQGYQESPVENTFLVDKYQSYNTSNIPPLAPSLRPGANIFPQKKCWDTTTTKTGVPTSPAPVNYSSYSPSVNRRDSSIIAQTPIQPQFSVDSEDRSLGFAYGEMYRGDVMNGELRVENSAEMSRNNNSLSQPTYVQEKAPSFRRKDSIFPKTNVVTSASPAPLPYDSNSSSLNQNDNIRIERKLSGEFVNQRSLGLANNGRQNNEYLSINEPRLNQDVKNPYDTHSIQPLQERLPTSKMRSDSIVAQEKPNEYRSTPAPASSAPHYGNNRPPLNRRDSVKIPPNILQRKPSIDQITKSSTESNSAATFNGISDYSNDQIAYVPAGSKFTSLRRQSSNVSPVITEQFNEASSSFTELPGRKNSRTTLEDVEKASDPTQEVVSSSSERRNSKVISAPEVEHESSSPLDLNQGYAPILQRRDSKLILTSDIPLDSNQETRDNSNRPSFTGSTSFETDRKLSSDQEPHGEYSTGFYPTTGYNQDTEDPNGSYRSTDVSQPIYEQYEGNNVDYYYDNNNYQPSRYEADQGYAENNGAAVQSVSAINYGDNTGNQPAYEHYEQPYYGDEFHSNVTPSDAYYPQAQNYQGYHNANYTTNETPENYVDYDAYNSNFADGASNYYGQDELLADCPPQENEDGIGKSIVAPTEVPASLLEEESSEQPTAQPIPIVEAGQSGSEEDTRKLSETSETVASGNTSRNRKASVENDTKVREPISRRASKVTLQSSSEDKRLKTQPVGNDLQKRASKTKLSENKLKRTPSTVNKIKTPISRRI